MQSRLAFCSQSTVFRRVRRAAASTISSFVATWEPLCKPKFQACLALAETPLQPEGMLTGAQKTKLRGIGQTLDSRLLVGQAGVTPGVLNELNRLINTHELVKVRFVGSDRHQRAALAEAIATQAGCEHVGSVGNIALFYRQNPDPQNRAIEI